MNYTQITCNPDEWDASTITVCGLTSNARKLLPRSLTARDPPEPQLALWHTLVEMMMGLDAGGWAATLIIVERAERFEKTVARGPEEGALPDDTMIPVVRMTVYRQWDDGTTASHVTLNLEQPEALGLYNYLTNAQTYENQQCACC